MYIAADHEDEHFVRSDIWAEGKWLDLWSVPHFLSGVVVAFCLHFFSFGIPASFVIAVLLLIAYEMFEVITRIEEMWTNRLMDVVVGMTSFTPTFLFIPSMSTNELTMTFGLVLTADIILSAIGWRESQKAAMLEKQFRAGLLEQRHRFVASRLRREKLRRERRMKKQVKDRFWNENKTKRDS
jgi:hypothetical protein